MYHSTQDFVPVAAPVAIAAVSKQCPNCGGHFPAGGRGLGKKFCTTSCRTDFNNRAKAEGAVCMALLKAWTGNRHAKPGTREAEVCSEARRELTEIVNGFVRLDREKGRPNVTDYVADMLSEGRYIDRTRKF